MLGFDILVLVLCDPEERTGNCVRIGPFPCRKRRRHPLRSARADAEKSTERLLHHMAEVELSVGVFVAKGQGLFRP